MDSKTKIALGGGCHWCTEAVFQSLIGVRNVEQGFVASTEENSSFSEAVIVHFNPEDISLQTLIEVHLHTHKSTSVHSMRQKYRSAIYYFSDEQKTESQAILNTFQIEFNNKLITKTFPFSEFKASREAIQNYYQKNPEKPFCERFINPKLKLIMDKFSQQVNPEYISNKQNRITCH
jgi:peptide-methionine (S)-S-oxide reductase